MAEQALIIDTPDGAIHGTRSDGRSDRVAILLHGGPGMSCTYLDPLVPPLADTFTTINYQQRGMAPSTAGKPFTVDANVDDAVAVIDQAAGGRAWIVGHSWGGHLALHMLVATPDRIEGAVILDPLGAFFDVFDEFGERLHAHLSPEQRARVDEIDAKEDRGEATPEESDEGMRLIWPGYFADPAAAPPYPDIEFSADVFVQTLASIRAHDEAGTLGHGLPAVPSSVPVLFVHGAKSPMPVSTTTRTAELIPHAAVEILPDAGHYLWVEDEAGMCGAIAAFVAATAPSPAG
jgi:pimeloyl-ACP methyl ester carboxylesterase